MKDPVKDLFDSLETETIPELKLVDPSQPIKKICIIFHGAPFTGNSVYTMKICTNNIYQIVLLFRISRNCLQKR